jgi:outer membrane protein assembly factor BamB
MSLLLAFLASVFASASEPPKQATPPIDVPRPPKIVTTQEWGSKPDPIPASRKQTPRFITLHHAGVLWTNSQDPAQFVRNMQSWGKRRPQIEKPPRDTYWPDLPYHFLIAPDGRIFEGRPVEYEPESNTKYPLAGNIGVEMMGDFNKQRPSKAQLESAVRLTAWLMQEHKITADRVRTHMDVAPKQTSCPGKDFYRYMEDGQFKKWCETLLRGEPLTIDPGPPLPKGPTENITETKPPNLKPEEAHTWRKRGDWPMLGGTNERNHVNLVETKLADDWDLKTKRNIKWVAELGSQSYGPPVIAGGKIFTGTNNGAGRNPRHPNSQDKGILMCFREEDGAFLWQAVHDKHPAGRVVDWPEQGVASTPCVEGDRVYYMSNLCELVCADVNGFANGNQGMQDEQYKDPTDADFIWKLNLMTELGVHPHNLAASSPLILDDLVYVNTGNGVDESHRHLPKPNAPSFLAVDKNTGRVVWHDNSPGKDVKHGQWSSPTVIKVNGKSQVVFPGGDAWLRGFEPKTGKLLWKFDCNPKGAVYTLGGRSTWNNFVAPIVAHEGKIFATVGEDPEHGEGVGHLWCIDPTKASPANIDLTPVNNNFDPKAPENRNSGLVWHFGGDEPGLDPQEPDLLFRRSLSCCAVNKGLCFVADFSGFVHCLNANTGKRHWEYDTFAAIWGSPYWADGKVYLGTEEGEVLVFDAGRACRLIAKNDVENSMYGSVVAANGVIYIKTRCKLIAVVNREGSKN